MLNKKAIAAFAAGATLLSGMALAAPAFVSAPAFADQTQKSAKAHLKDLEKKMNDAKDKYEAKKAEYDAAKTKSDKSAADKAAALTDDAKKAVKEDGNPVDASKYTVTNGVVAATAAAPAAEKDTVVAAAQKYLDAKKAAEADAAATQKLEGEVTPLKTAYDQAVLAYTAANTTTTEADQKLKSTREDLTKAQGKVDEAFGKYVDAYVKMKAARSELTKAQRALADFEDSTPKTAKDYKKNLKSLKAAVTKAQNAFNTVDEANDEAKAAFEDAKKAYNDALDKYRDAYKAAENNHNAITSENPDDLTLDPADYDVVAKAAAKKGGNTGSGSEGEGGSSENDKDKNKGKITPEEAKALAEFAVKYMKDSKSDPKTVASLKAALAKVTAAKKAKDAKALVAALKELKALVEPLMKKAPAKDTGKALESIFGSDVLYTKYKGLAVDLIKLGVTNIGAYDGLLNQLEFGLSRFGWDNVIKNFPEHGPKNNCDFLAWLRRHLTKAVAHYGHVEAAVKDVQAELNEDMKDAQARHDWDAVKVIDQKIALANGLREVAHHNLTRAKALLDSANDHARDLSCDTAAKEVRAAMDKEPNSPFKKSGQKNNAQKPNGQNGQKPNGGAASHQLGKTGATVALVAVAASVLAGMGAALRKIRH